MVWDKVSMYYTLVHKSLGPVKLNPKTFSEVGK